ncbi:MAG: 5'-nucleotidase C-terminal domain-containing protein [Spirochaetaceae bacterium]|nr:5'-nucleotidase C-terminal domain-containing protein [Spirochaetaceae bacterium]
MKKRFWGFVSIAIAFGMIFASCATNNASGPVKRELGKAYELTILHLNDTHGAVVATDGKGGLSFVADCIKKEKAKATNSLVVHAGDINTGSALSNMFNAEPDIKAFNAMGVDVATLGNHEFDGTMAKLKKQISQSKFTWLSANIKTANGKYFTKPYIIKNYDGFRIAVVGLTTNRTQVIASPDKSLVFADEIETAREMVKIVREQELADIVIFATHIGDVEEAIGHVSSVKLAQSVEGIDLIIDGHSHSYFEKPLVVNGCYIVSANEYGKYVGKGVMEIVDGKLKSFNWAPIAITSDNFSPDPQVEKILAPYIDKANKSLKDVVLKTTAEFEFGNRLPRYIETAIGDFVADAVVDYVESTGVKLDGAFTNGGNIRAPLPKGNVTREDILTVLPFENYVYVISLKGDDVERLFQFIASIKQGNGGFAQVSKEIRYTITYDKNGNGKLSNLTIGGKPIDKNKTYRIATNDYLAGGGDGYEILKKSVDTYNTSMLFSTVVIDYAARLGSGAITPMTDGRITVIGGTLPE